MAFESLLHEIDAQISRLQQAKALLSGKEGKRGPGRPAKTAIPVNTASPKRTLSVQARKKIADAQKMRWAKIRAGKKVDAKKAEKK
jgi:hypothetical protein